MKDIQLEFKSIFDWLPSSYIPYLVFLLSLLAFFYFRYRAKSGFSIIHRILIFLFGKEQTQKNEGELINDIFRIEKFNFYYNTNAYSIKQVQEFERKVRKYELDYRLLSKLKRHFDIDEFKVLNVPSKKIMITHLVLFIMLLTIPLSASFTHNSNFKSSALLKFNNNETWYWINNNEIKPFNFILQSEKTLTKKSCELNEDTINAKEFFSYFCEFLTEQNKEHQNFIDTAIAEQKESLLLLLGVWFFLVCLETKLIFSLGYRLDADNMLKKRIKE